MTKRKKSRAINGDDILDPIDVVKQIIKLYNASNKDDKVAVQHLINSLNRKRPLIAYCDAYDNYYERLATIQLITDKNHNIQHVIWHMTDCEIWYNVDVETNTIEQRMDGRYIHNVAIAYLDNGPFNHITLTDNTTITYRGVETIKMRNYACAHKFLDIKTINGMELTINVDQIQYLTDRG